MAQVCRTPRAGLRHEAVQREHGLASSHDGLVDWLVGVVAVLEGGNLAGACSVMNNGAVALVRRAT